MPPAPALTAAPALEGYLDDLERQTPALAEIITAFRPLLAGQAELKTGLPTLDEPLPALDAARLAQGVPLATADDLLAGRGLGLATYLGNAAAVLLPRLGQGFPNLAPDLAALAEALRLEKLDAAACLEALLKGDNTGLEARAQDAGLQAASLEFILLQLAKPLLEKRAESLATLLQGQEWTQGSCPVCGSLPEMAYLEGEAGQRWLRCSLCAQHWRFSRTRCPVCGNEDQDMMEFFYVEGREDQRVNSCRQCGKYVLTLDVRGLDQKPAWPAAALGLVHLDLLAQEKGLTPAAWTPWNQVK